MIYDSLALGFAVCAPIGPLGVSAAAGGASSSHEPSSPEAMEVEHVVQEGQQSTMVVLASSEMGNILHPGTNLATILAPSIAQNNNNNNNNISDGAPGPSITIGSIFTSYHELCCAVHTMDGYNRPKEHQK